MVGLLVGQIVEQTTAPYTWFPWVIVGLGRAGQSPVAFWLGATGPERCGRPAPRWARVDDVERGARAGPRSRLTA